MIKKQSIEYLECEDGKKYLDNFQILNKIGEGTFGKILMAINTITKEKVAIKLLSKKKICINNDEIRVKREIEIMKKLIHTNIVQLYYIIETEKTICLILEYCSGKDLIEVLKQRKKLREAEAVNIFLQLILAIQYIHSFKIAHRDIKLENILYSENNISIKLIDFGLSNNYGNKKNLLLESACGSPSYASPEIILGKKYCGVKSDIWSCGVVLFAIVNGFLPFEAINERELYKKIINGTFNIPNVLSNDLKDLLKKLLNVNSEKRISINEVLCHPWLKTFNNSSVIKGINANIVPPIDYEVVNVMIRITRDNFYYKSLDSTNYLKKIIESIILKYNNELSAIYYLLVKRKIKNKLIFIDNNYSNEIKIEMCNNTVKPKKIRAILEDSKQYNNFNLPIPNSNYINKKGYSIFNNNSSNNNNFISFKNNKSVSDFASELFKNYIQNNLVYSNLYNNSNLIESIINNHVKYYLSKYGLNNNIFDKINIKDNNFNNINNYNKFTLNKVNSNIDESVEDINDDVESLIGDRINNYKSNLQYKLNNKTNLNNTSKKNIEYTLSNGLKNYEELVFKKKVIEKSKINNILGNNIKTILINYH